MSPITAIPGSQPRKRSARPVQHSALCRTGAPSMSGPGLTDRRARPGGIYVCGAGGVVAAASRILFWGCYLVTPLPVCEITPLAALVAFELFVMSVGKPVTGSIGGPAVCIGVPVPVFNVLWQAVSYCAAAPTLLFACALLYACPPLPPLALLPMKPVVVGSGGSLNTDPGDVAALPGVLPPPTSVPWQLLPWGLGSA